MIFSPSFMDTSMVVTEESFDQSRMMRIGYNYVIISNHIMKCLEKLMVHKIRVARWDIDAEANALARVLLPQRRDCAVMICLYKYAMRCWKHFPNFGFRKEAVPHLQLWGRYYTQKYIEAKSTKPESTVCFWLAIRYPDRGTCELLTRTSCVST